MHSGCFSHFGHRTVPTKTLLLISGLCVLLGRPALAGLSPDLHWYVDGAYGTAVDGNTFLGGTKALRAVGQNGSYSGRGDTFDIFEYHWWKPDTLITSFHLEEFTSPNGNTWSRINSAWQIPFANQHYLFYDAHTFVDPNTNPTTTEYFDYSPEIIASTKAVAFRLDQNAFHIDAHAEAQGKGPVGKGTADITAGGSSNSTVVSVEKTIDPSLHLAIVFPRSEADTEDCGPLDVFCSTFSMSEWDQALRNFGTPPAGWFFGLDKTDLTDMDFSGNTANLLLTVTADASVQTSIVPFEILTEIFGDDGLQFSGSPTYAYRATAMPEPSTLTLTLSLAIVALVVSWYSKSRPARGCSDFS